MKLRIRSIVVVVFIFIAGACSDTKQSELIFAHFIKRHVEQVKPIMSKYNEAMWATYSGKSSFSELLAETKRTDSLYKSIGEPTEYYQSLLHNVYDNATDFELLMKIKQTGLIQDTLLKREFMDVFREYVFIKNDWEATDKRKAKLYEQFFELKKTESAFWDSISQVKGVNSRKIWIERYAALGEDFKDMVKAMNGDAQRLGYANYYQMVMDFNGVDYSSLDKISDIVESETDLDYRKLLDVSYKDLYENYGITKDEFTPKHYSYSLKQMMVPKEWRTDFDKDECIDIVRSFFALGDYNIDGIIENSDLWYEEDKVNQSFFFCNEAMECDYRIYANVKPNTMGIYTLLHEFGHAVHYKNVNDHVPYLLRDPHEIATEGVAIYFNDKLYHSPTLRKMMGIEKEANSPYYQAFLDPSRLVFLRKLVRNIQFEKSIFEDPNQDFNVLWWNLNKRYMLQDIKAEDRHPEWMSNQHIINASGIHVFYLFAFAFSAQLEHHFPDNNISALKYGLMQYGDTKEWDDLLKNVTGEKLNLNYLFNSYKWKNKKNVPITFDAKPSNRLSYLEKVFTRESEVFALKS